MKNIILSLTFLFFLATSSSAQTFEWALTGTGNLVDAGNSVCMDGEGNSYITGYFSSNTLTLGEITLTNSSTLPGSNDMFVAKIDNSGKVIWAMQSTGNGDEKGIDIVCDNTGHLVVAGLYKGEKAVFGTTELTNSAKNSYSILLMRINLLGNILWVKQAGGKSDMLVKSLSCGPLGEFYITGSFTYGVTLGGYEYKSKSGNNTSVFVARYHSNGELKWFEQIYGKGKGGQNSRQSGEAVYATNDSRFVYVAGWFHGKVTFGNEVLTSNDFDTPSSGWKNIFLTKYDSDGRTIWTEVVGVNQVNLSTEPEVKDICADNDGSCYMTGYFPGVLIFGNDSMRTVPSKGNTYNNDVFLAKYDADGNHLWHKSAGGSQDDKSNSIALTSNGVLITGNCMWGDAKFGNISLTQAFPNMFIANYSGSGECLWAVQSEAVVSSTGNGIASFGKDITVTGQFLGNKISFGSISSKGAGSGNMFVTGIR